MLLKCLCHNNRDDCAICAASAKEQWKAFGAQHPDASAGQLLEQAIRQNLPEVVFGILQNTDLNINRPCDPERYESVSPFLTALRADLPRIAALIAGQSRFDVAASLPEYECLNWARRSSLETLHLFLSLPAISVNHQNGNGKTLLHEAVYDLASTEKVNYLLTRPGVLIDARQNDGTTPLYRACLAKNEAAFDLLFEKKADINNRNNDNLWTILLCAVAQNSVNIVQKLIDRPDLDINAADDRQNTALHVAAQRGHDAMAGLLMQCGNLRINLKDNKGLTPLAVASFAGHTNIVRRLLKRPELEVNWVDCDRQTPLFLAAMAGNIDVVRLLLADSRTNIAITSHPARQTAKSIAESIGHTAIANLFEGLAETADELSPSDSYTERTPEPPWPKPVYPQRR